MQRKYSQDYSVDRTLLHMETLLDVTKTVSYKKYWRRAYSKIKIQNILKRFSKGRQSFIFLSENQFTDHSTMVSQIKKPPKHIKYILFPQNHIYLLWLFLVLICVIFISSYSIFSTAFIGDENNPIATRIEILSDIIFVLDIIINFNLAYFDDSNHLVKSRKKITFEYLKWKFFIDFVVVLPFFGVFHNYPNLYSFRYALKLLKWITLKNQISHLMFIKELDYLSISNKNFLDSLFLIFIYIISLHVSGCFYFIAARYEDFSIYTWISKVQIQDQRIGYKYLTAIYWSLETVTTVGYGDVHPYTTLEIGITMIWMCFGVLCISNIASQFTLILKNVFKKDMILDRNIQIVEDFSRKVRLPRFLERILMQAIRDNKIVTHRFNVSNLIQFINIDLRFEIANDIYGKALTKIPFFTQKSEEFVSVFTFYLEFVQFHQEEYIWFEKAFSDGIYFVISGRVKYYYEKKMFYVYNEGGFFGDIEVFLKIQRKFNVMAGDLCKCLRISKLALQFLKSHYPIYYNELKGMRKTRLRNLMNGLAQMTMIFRFKGKENFESKKDYIEKVKEEMFAKVFGNEFFAYEESKLEDFLNDLNYFEWIYKNVDRFCQELLRENR